MSEFLFWLFISVGTLNMLHVGFYLIGANIYDMQQFKRQAGLKRQKRQRGKRPLVSVVIPAHNEEQVIVRCLESVRRSSYRKLQIIVANDASTDSTAKIVRDYMAKYPKRDIRLCSKRKNVGKGTVLNHALKNYAKGDLVMTLDADSLIDKHAIRNAVAYFADPQVTGVAANVRIITENTLLGMLQKFEHMLGYRSKKIYSVTNCEFVIGGVGSMYRMGVLREVGFYDTDTVTEDIGLSFKIAAQGNRVHRLVYAVDVAAMTESVQTYPALFKQRFRWKFGNMQNLYKYRGLMGKVGDSRYSKMLSLYRLPMAILGELLLLAEPFILGYVLYLTYISGNTALIVGAYTMITLYILLSLLPDEHTTWRERAKMAAYTPVMYFVFYVMNAVQLVSVLRCIVNMPKIIRRNTASHWVSPKRRGQEVAPA